MLPTEDMAFHVSQGWPEARFQADHLYYFITFIDLTLRRWEVPSSHWLIIPVLVAMQKGPASISSKLLIVQYFGSHSWEDWQSWEMIFQTWCSFSAWLAAYNSWALTRVHIQLTCVTQFIWVNRFIYITWFPSQRYGTYLDSSPSPSYWIDTAFIPYAHDLRTSAFCKALFFYTEVNIVIIIRLGFKNYNRQRITVLANIRCCKGTSVNKYIPQCVLLIWIRSHFFSILNKSIMKQPPFLLTWA